MSNRPGCKIHEEFLRIVLKYYPEWRSSPAGFLGLIETINFAMKGYPALHGMSQEDAAMEGLCPLALRLAEVFIRVLPLRLDGFEHIGQIAACCTSGIDPQQSVDEIFDQYCQTEGLYNMLYDLGVLPSEGTMMLDALVDAEIRTLIESLRPHLEILPFIEKRDISR